jgi:hypothetical protein
MKMDAKRMESGLLRLAAGLRMFGPMEVYLFIFGLSNDALNCSDYLASNDMITAE